MPTRIKARSIRLRITRKALQILSERLQQWSDQFYSRMIQKRLALTGVPDACAIHTFTTRKELEALHRLARSCPSGAYALEIGSYLGASTCYIAAGLVASNSHLICVDTWLNETMPDGIHNTFEEFLHNTRGVSGRILTIQKKSADVKDADIPAPLHFIFIDGDHSYPAAKLDMALVSPWLAKGGVIAFHDALVFEGVSRVLGEALASCEWKIAGQVENLVWIERAEWNY